MRSALHAIFTAIAAILIANCSGGCIPPFQAAKELETSYKASIDRCLDLATKAERHTCKIRVNTEYGLCSPPAYPELQLCGESDLATVPMNSKVSP